MLHKRSQKKQVSLPRSAATKKANISKAGREMKVEEDDQIKGEEHFNDKQAAVLPSSTEEQALFENTCRLSHEKREDSDGLPRKESGAAAHVFVGIFESGHDTE